MRITEKIILKTTLEERLIHTALIFDEIRKIFADKETFKELGLIFMTKKYENREFYVMFGDDKSGRHITRIQIKDSPAEAIDFTNTLPVKCEKENYILMAALLNRMNKMRFGTFTLGESDGSITFNYSYCLFGQRFSHAYFLFYLQATQRMCMSCLDEIKRIAIGRLSEDEKKQFLSDIETLADCLLNR